MRKIQISRHTSDSLVGRRMQSAKGSRNVDGPPDLTAAQREWNEQVEERKRQKKERQRGGK